MRDHLWTELEALRQAAPDEKVHARRAWLWAQEHPTSALYEEIARRGGWDDARMADRARDALLRDLIRAVYYVIPVYPAAAAAPAVTVTVAGSRLVNTYLPAGRLNGTGPQSGFELLETIQADTDKRAHQVARFRWEVEALWRRYAALQLKEINDLIQRMAESVGFESSL